MGLAEAEVVVVSERRLVVESEPAGAAPAIVAAADNG